MPTRPKTHQPARMRAERPSAHRRGYTRDWQAASKAFLAEHPTCAHCELVNVTTAAACVDHIQPHRGNEELFWRESNWMALCKRCHDRKTRRGE